MRYLTALLALLVSLGGHAADTQRPQFTFTAIPDQNEAELVRRFQQVADYLSGELGVEVRYIPVKSYPAAITAFRNNQVQLAWFGAVSVPARPNSDVIVTREEREQLESIVRSRSLHHGLVRRARIVLDSADGIGTFLFHT